MNKLKPYIILYLILFMSSVGGIFSKLAATKQFLSFEWLLDYAVVILILGVYAIVWQQMLKKVQLNIAYASKSTTLIWGMLWGVLFFNETLTPTNIIGGVIVIAGVILMVTGGEKKHE